MSVAIVIMGIILGLGCYSLFLIVFKLLVTIILFLIWMLLLFMFGLTSYLFMVLLFYIISCLFKTLNVCPEVNDINTRINNCEY